MELVNYTPLDMQTMYAGLPFRFPAGLKVRIKDVPGPQGKIPSSDIAAKCIEDLGRRGLVLIDEDDPQPESELRETSMEAFEQFARDNVGAYNELNVELANEGRPKARAPKDLQVLVKLLQQHFKPDASDEEAHLMADQTFQRITKSRDGTNGTVLLEAKQALAAGDLDRLRDLLGNKGTVVPAGVSGHGDASLDAEQMETTLVDVQHPKGHAPGRPPRQARVPGKPGLRKGGRKQ